MLSYSSMKWMCNNLLKLNQDKTELVVKILNVRMGDEFIAPKSSACNPGVIVDNCFFMKKHVKRYAMRQITMSGTYQRTNKHFLNYIYNYCLQNI